MKKPFRIAQRTADHNRILDHAMIQMRAIFWLRNQTEAMRKAKGLEDDRVL